MVVIHLLLFAWLCLPSFVMDTSNGPTVPSLENSLNKNMNSTWCVLKLLLVSNKSNKNYCATLYLYSTIIIFLSSFVIALLVFLGVVLFPCLIKKFSSKSNCGKLVLGLLLSYCSRFCNLIALLWAPKTNSMEALRGLSIWDKITSPEIMWGFIIVLFFISSVRVYQGKGAFTNYVYKVVKKNRLFVNSYTIENVNGGG